MVKFISYSGAYPTLCFGTLTLEIDGRVVTFGIHKDCDYYKFWSSGGRCGFRNGYTESYVETDEWEFEDDEFPDEFLKYYDEIKELFNENVEYGCCGGCL